MGNNQVQKEEQTNIATVTYGNEDKYEGEILNLMRNGYGTYTYFKGDKYQGMWVNNLKHGRGTMFFKNAEIYEGWWNNNQMEGVGTYYYANGDKYYGEWKENKRHGKGMINYADGSTFMGQFKYNKKHGKAETVGLNNNQQYEEWKEGKLQKKTEKPKNIDKTDFHHQFDVTNFQKAINDKKALQPEEKKHLHFELAKNVKSKNLNEGINLHESMKTINQSLLLGKSDICMWKAEDLCVLFGNLELEKFQDVINNNQLDGVKFANMDMNQVITLFKASEKNDINLILFIHNMLRKIKKDGDYLKSMRSIKSMKKEVFKKDDDSEGENSRSNTLSRKKSNVNENVGYFYLF